MNFVQIGASDARFIELQIHGDERGHFARTWCANEFAAQGIDFTPAQGNTSLTRVRGTVRGMHFQRFPKADAKIVRCVVGRIHDIIVDLRADSPTRGEVYTNELSGDAPAALYVPAGFAHGFQTLTDDALVEYLMGAEYVSNLYDGFRYNDPAFNIAWPEPIKAVSENDLKWPDLAARIPWLNERR